MLKRLVMGGLAAVTMLGAAGITAGAASAGVSPEGTHASASVARGNPGTFTWGGSNTTWIGPNQH